MRRDKKFGYILILVTFLIIPVMGWAQNVSNPKYDDYFTGLKLYKKGLFEQSIKSFQRFLDAHPDNTVNQSAYYYLVKAEAQVDTIQTNTYFKKYLVKFPKGEKAVNVLIELGNRADRDGAHQKAIGYYKQAIKLHPKEDLAARIYYWMAESAASMGNHKQSRKYFLNLADTFPKSGWAPKALYARGRSYLDDNNYSDASDAFELLKKRYRNNPITRKVGTALGESYYKQRRFHDAIKALKNAMPYLDKQSRSKATYLIAESYNYLNNYREASNYYLRFINYTKGTSKVRLAYYGLGWVYHKQKIYHWASDAFGRAAKGNDLMARKALYYQAVNEELGGRYNAAIKTFRKFGKKYKKGPWVEHAYYEWAMTAFQTGRYQESIETCLSLIRGKVKMVHPGKVFSLLGQAYFADGEYTHAIQAFNEAQKEVHVNPNVKWQARFQKAWVLYQNQAYKQAQPLFDTIYQKDRNSKLAPQALFWSADCYYHMKKYTRASVRFTDFIDKYPKHKFIGAARYSLGWCEFKMGRYQKAIPPFKMFLAHYNPPPISLFPYNIDTELRIGDSYYAMKDYDKAIQYYQKAVGSDRGGDYALYQIANSYYRSDQSYEAVTTLRKLLKMYPSSSLRQQAQYNIGYIYFLTNNYDQAVKEFDKVINKYPGSNWAARAQYNIGDAYYNAGEYKKSVAAYKKVLQKYPKSNYIIDAVNGIQYAEVGAGKKDNSSQVLENFLAKHPQTGMADKLRFRQAQNLLQSGNYSAAIKSFEEYIRITNNNRNIPEAYFNIANAYEQENKTGQAVKAYETIVNNYGNSDRASTSLANLGRLYYKEKKYQKSLQYYQKLSNDKGYRVEAYLGMGNAYLGMNQLDNARKEFNNALNIKSSSNAAKLGIAKVDYAQQNYDSAMPVFRKIAKNNTDAVGAQAQFMIGKTLQTQGNYNEALKAYSKVKILYEAYDNWVSKALLQSAACYRSLGKKGEAQNTLRALVKKYPNSMAARDAAKKMKSK